MAIGRVKTKVEKSGGMLVHCGWIYASDKGYEHYPTMVAVYLCPHRTLFTIINICRFPFRILPRKMVWAAEAVCSYPLKLTVLSSCYGFRNANRATLFPLPVSSRCSLSIRTLLPFPR
jgi:hypothetical protein